MKLQCSVSALTLTLALASQPVLAQGHGGGSHGGGGHGGGGYHGGGSAVPRNSSGPGYGHGGGMAQQRHPRAGTGTGYHYGYGGYGHGGYGHGGYGHGHYYGGGYYPYYGYGYRPYNPYYAYPYYSYWPGISLSFGWGSSAPYYYGGYSASPSYSVGAYGPSGAMSSDDSGAEAPPPRDAERSYNDRSYDDRSYDDRSSGRIRLEVRPDDASVYVDDQFHGTAREARIMKLRAGPHVIELIRPGFAVERREVTVVSGESRDVLVELLRASR